MNAPRSVKRQRGHMDFGWLIVAIQVIKVLGSAALVGLTALAIWKIWH